MRRKKKDWKLFNFILVFFSFLSTLSLTHSTLALASVPVCRVVRRSLTSSVVGIYVAVGSKIYMFVIHIYRSLAQHTPH